MVWSTPGSSRPEPYQEAESLSWSPSQYLKFGDHRLRPAVDLLARVPDASPIRIVDLGCGTGSVTALIRRRWPEAQVIGVDDSPEMLEQARQGDPGVDWRQASIENWVPDSPPDLIVSNSALHWLDRHDQVFPRLAQMLAAGGVLAVQMPRNFAAPSHTCITRAVQAGPWKDRLGPLTRSEPVSLPAYYHELLSPRVEEIDVWEIEYFQVLRGESPVVEWTSGTILRPLLAALSDTERTQFLQAYEKCVGGAYPPRSDGTTLFPFKRLFIIART